MAETVSPGTRKHAAIVTGVSRRRGIAAAVCRALIREGWDVVACGWPPYDREVRQSEAGADSVDALIQELAPTGRFLWHQLDLEPPGSAAALFDSANHASIDVDALVIAHARSLPGGLLKVTPADLDHHLAVNARATLLLIAEFARRWHGQPGRGRIVTFVSGPPLPGEIAYAASKGAVEWLTFSAAAELASWGISVNAVDPGPTDTDWMGSETKQSVLHVSPLGRVGQPEDAAELVAFLCSDSGGWITGQRLRSDGGWSHLRP